MEVLAKKIKVNGAWVDWDLSATKVKIGGEWVALDSGRVAAVKVKIGGEWVEIPRVQVFPVEGAPNGVYILATDNLLYKREAWNASDNSKAVGVAVLSDDCKFVISKQQGGIMIWGGYGTTISSVVATTDSNTAKKDYSGKDNTDKIIDQLGSSEAEAANYCKTFTFPNGKKGYLGSLGEWQEAYNNKSEIDACMSLIGGEAIYAGYYHWTSTQCSSNNAWILYWSDGYVYDYRKSNSYWVRAFAAL